MIREGCRTTASRLSVPRRFKIVVPLLALVLLIGSPVVTRASSSGCTGVDSGVTCFYIYGTGLWVDKFVQSRDNLTWPEICNYQAGFPVFDKPGGTRIWLQWSSFHSGCMYSFRATRTTYAYQYFPNNSYACGDWYENYSKLGRACNYIHS